MKNLSATYEKNLRCGWKHISLAYESTWFAAILAKFAAIIPWFAAKSTGNGGKLRSYIHDPKSLHPILQRLTPISIPIYTHSQYLLDSITDLIP